MGKGLCSTQDLIDLCGSGRVRCDPVSGVIASEFIEPILLTNRIVPMRTLWVMLPPSITYLSRREATNNPKIINTMTICIVCSPVLSVA